MSRTARRDLVRVYGVSQVTLAEQTQAAYRSAGVPCGSLKDILEGKQYGGGRSSKTVGDLVGNEELTDRQLKRKGTVGQAAVLLDKAALTEKSPMNRAKLREASALAKEVAEKVQLEFDFFEGGNWMTSNEYYDHVMAAIKGKPRWRDAAIVWMEIMRNLPWQNFTCAKTAVEIADDLEMDKSNMAKCLKILEDAGAIRRVKKGRSKVITVTPEGVYRGKVQEHQEAVKRYKAEVHDLFPQS